MKQLLEELDGNGIVSFSILYRIVVGEAEGCVPGSDVIYFFQYPLSDRSG